MNTKQNIFERFAAQNQENNFVGLNEGVNEKQPSQPVNEFTYPLNEGSSTPQSKGNIFERLAVKEKEKQDNQFGWLDTAKDIGQQVLSKGIAGIGGAYGNILDTFGLQTKLGETLSGKEAINKVQFEILDKMNRGEAPSFGELMLLSDDDDIAPNYNRLPNSNQIKEGIKDLTGIGEGKTPEGRIAGQGAQFLGEGIPLGGGGKALAVLGGAGLAGQGIREAGGPEGLATAVEIGAPLLHGAVSSKLAPTSKASKEIVDAGRKIGLTEKQITPLIQGENKSSALSKFARKGTKTKNLFESIKETLGDSYNTIKGSAQAKVKLPNAEQISLRKEFGNIRNELSKTLAPSPDKEAAINYIEKSLETLRNNNVTPEFLVNFWQDINKSVKWNSINGGKKALAQLKEPLLNTLKKVSPGLAEDFELTNHLYSKYAQISKKLKPNLVDSFFNKGEVVSVIPSGLALVYGNPMPLMALGGEVATRLLSREMLINPYFQNLANKLVTNFNQGSLKGVTELVKQAQEYMKRKHPNEDWEFLTRDKED